MAFIWREVEDKKAGRPVLTDDDTDDFDRKLGGLTSASTIVDFSLLFGPHFDHGDSRAKP